MTQYSSLLTAGFVIDCLDGITQWAWVTGGGPLAQSCFPTGQRSDNCAAQDYLDNSPRSCRQCKDDKKLKYHPYEGWNHPYKCIGYSVEGCDKCGSSSHQSDSCDHCLVCDYSEGFIMNSDRSCLLA